MASSSRASLAVVSPTGDADHIDYDDYNEDDDDDDDDEEEEEEDYDDYDDDDDLERNISKREARGLVAAVVHGNTKTKKTNAKQHYDADDDDDDDDDDHDSRSSTLLAPIRFDPGKCIFYTVVAIFCLSSISIFLPSRYQQQQQQQQNTTSITNHNLTSSSSPAMTILEYHCPSSIRKGGNYDESFEAEYVEVTKQITNNMSQFAQEFRETNFDDWDRTYEQVKNGMYHWKSTRFTPLESGDSIYESACGIGLNLYMTLEILQETRNITHLVVYGNEYLKISADKANAVMEQIAPAEATKGVICPGDSTDLPFVPSNAFDLVYTGYLSPILDPLHLGLNLKQNFEIYSQVCNEAQNKSAPYSGSKQAMVDKAQDEQNRWYETWVREMIRIAKPGKAVIIEQVSQPYCDAMFDWGGVPKEWWSQTIAKHWKNDIDPDSLYIEDDVIFPARYHVYMRKKVASS